MITEQSRFIFFTATILNWKLLLTDDNRKQIITDSLGFLAVKKRIKVYAFVIMPNHLHLIWSIIEPNKKEDVQRDFLKFTAQQLKFSIQDKPELLKQFYVGAKDREYQIWERNPLSVELLSRKMTEQKLDYIHHNPVQEKWKLADIAENYRYSSARYYLRNIDEWKFITHYMEG